MVSQIITLGYGASSAPKWIVTLGYSSAEVAVPTAEDDEVWRAPKRRRDWTTPRRRRHWTIRG